MNISQILTKLKALIYSKSETDSLLGGKANSSHTHTKSQITDFPSYGNTAGTICQGNDSRLSDARTPTSHTHTKSQITDFPTIPSKTSQLTNDSGFLTSHQSLSNYSTLANTVKSLSISGKTITVTPGSGNAYTLTTQDTTYSHPTSSGNKHIPSGGSSGQFLGWSADGTAKWVNNPNTNTWNAMVGATSSANGSVGYVNAVPPKDGYNTKYLRADGTWQVPPDHTYTVNNATLTIQKNGTNVATFTSNASSNATANITVPTKVSQLTNDSGFITSSGSCNYANYSGYVQGDKSTGLYVNSVKYGNALATTNQSNFGAIWNAPTKNYRVACATYPNSNDDVYLCYSITNANVSSSTNTVTKDCVWNAGDGTLRTANIKATNGLYYNSYRIYVG